MKESKDQDLVKLFSHLIFTLYIFWISSCKRKKAEKELFSIYICRKLKFLT